MEIDVGKAESVLDALETLHIISIEKENEYEARLTEQCDRWYSCLMNKITLLKLADEIKEIAETLEEEDE